ncbi:AAA family ATPase [Catenovulum sp. SM1970]|uniref:ExeA family protein n=1 Tax=Marinifaba aquimaris TaxID=2741323 RepID=UPI001573C8EA|nr:AAA family ATPase [Marinifaba aquimaris]NTS78158.1 AAA family ATPase [Marinifaba aquimaris]
MYNGFFGLKETPFSIAPNPDYLFMSERHKEALAHLMFGLRETGGFVLLTGEVGTGKTTTSRCLIEQVPEDTKVAFILNPTLSEHELLATICDEFNIANDKSNTLKELTDKIRDFLLINHQAEQNALLIIDEAQHLKPEVLEQLRLLTNLETNTKKLLQVILIGQPELQELLKRKSLRQLAQRITARYHLLPLTQLEVAAYVHHRLNVAGRSLPLFTKSAIKQLHQLSGGVPRIINLLCDRALMGAYSQQKQSIDHKIIKQAAKEALAVDVDEGFDFNKFKTPAKYLTAVALVLALGIGVGAQLFSDNADSVPAITDKSMTDSVVDKEATAADKPVHLVQPELMTASVNLEKGFKDLLSLWQVDTDALAADPCLQMADWRLSCYWLNTDLSELVRLNYPALLYLQGEQGPFYAVLAAKGGHQYNLILNGQSVQVDDLWLADYWQGGAVILWQPSLGFAGEIDNDSSAEQFQWLEDNLAVALNYMPRPVAQFDRQLQMNLNRFQLLSGLAVSPYADMLTLIALHQKVLSSGPKIVE